MYFYYKFKLAVDPYFAEARASFFNADYNLHSLQREREREGEKKKGGGGGSCEILLRGGGWDGERHRELFRLLIL